MELFKETFELIALMSKEEVEKIYNIALKTGVKKVRWSGLTKKEDKLT